MNNEASISKKQFWLNHVEAANNSGLSIAQYAKRHEIKAQQLYHWRSVIKNSSNTVSTDVKFTRVVTTSMPSTSSRVTLKLSNATLEFDTLPDPGWVSAVLSQVAARQ